MESIKKTTRQSTRIPQLHCYMAYKQTTQLNRSVFRVFKLLLQHIRRLSIYKFTLFARVNFSFWNREHVARKFVDRFWFFFLLLVIHCYCCFSFPSNDSRANDVYRTMSLDERVRSNSLHQTRRTCNVSRYREMKTVRLHILPSQRADFSVNNHYRSFTINTKCGMDFLFQKNLLAKYAIKSTKGKKRTRVKESVFCCCCLKCFRMWECVCMFFGSENLNLFAYLSRRNVFIFFSTFNEIAAENAVSKYFGNCWTKMNDLLLSVDC